MNSYLLTYLVKELGRVGDTEKGLSIGEPRVGVAIGGVGQRRVVGETVDQPEPGLSIKHDISWRTSTCNAIQVLNFDFFHI